MRKIMMLAVAGLLAACASSPRGNAPAQTVVLPEGLDPSARCVIAKLNALYPAGGLQTTAITHAIQIVDPGRVYEIAPQQSLGWGGEGWFVRLTAVGKTTNAEVFAAPSVVADVSRAVQACAAPAPQKFGN